jgi:hypothetical protein
MTRYRIAVGQYWLAAVYDGSSTGIKLTLNKEDACSWATQEKALAAYAVATERFLEGVQLDLVEEPDYPASWGAKKHQPMPVEVTPSV